MDALLWQIFGNFAGHVVLIPLIDEFGHGVTMGQYYSTCVVIVSLRGTEWSHAENGGPHHDDRPGAAAGRG